MHIEISTANNIEGSDALTTHIKEWVQDTLIHFADHVTRVEVHLSDTNANKRGLDDKQCVMEARLEGRQPTVVKHFAGTLDQATKGAVDKLKSSLESTIGRLRDGH